MLNKATNPLNALTGGIIFYFQLNKTGGFADLGHLDANSFSFKSERGKKYSNRTGVKRLVYSWAKSYDIDFKVKGWEATKFALQMATLSSTPAAQTQAAGDVVDEDFVAKLDRGVPVANQMISTVVVKDAATGAITYVEGTHYEVDYQLGLICALSTGTITADEALHISYHKAAMTSLYTMNLLQTSRFVGDAKAKIVSNNGAVQAFYFPNVELQPDGDLSFGEENPADVASFSGSVVMDTTQAAGAEFGKLQELVAALTSS